MINNKPTQILREAGNLIRQYGWVKGAYRSVDDEGNTLGYCIMGAIRDAGIELGGTTGDIQDAKHRANRVAEQRKGVLGVSYNDFYAESKEDIISLLEEA